MKRLIIMKKSALKFEKINDAVVVSNNRFLDERGSFLKVFNHENLLSMGIDFGPKETFLTVSKKDVLRGIHFQTPPFAHDKLVSCLQGQVLDVFIDLRKKSKDYGQVYSLKLSEDDPKTLFLPKGFGHGFLALTDQATLLYEVSEGYNSEYDKGINPLSIDFNWPVKAPLVSARDLEHVQFANFESVF